MFDKFLSHVHKFSGHILAMGRIVRAINHCHAAGNKRRVGQINSIGHGIHRYGRQLAS